MTRIEKIRIQMVKEKAAKVLKVKVQNILKVHEGVDGAGVELKNGNRLCIPHEIWVLGMTEEEYVAHRFAK